MEKRRSRRITVNLKAERISGNERYGVFIENISEYGIHMITSPQKSHEKFIPGTDINLKFFFLSGETINLNCKVRWAIVKIPTNGLTDSVGLEIIDPPLKYIEFVQNLL
jgi:hypothetical protein